MTTVSIAPNADLMAETFRQGIANANAKIDMLTTLASQVANGTGDYAGILSLEADAIDEALWDAINAEHTRIETLQAALDQCVLAQQTSRVLHGLQAIVEHDAVHAQFGTDFVRDAMTLILTLAKMAGMSEGGKE